MLDLPREVVSRILNEKLPKEPKTNLSMQISKGTIDTMKYFSRYALLLFFALYSIATTNLVQAQSILPPGYEEEVVTEMVPSIPRPGEKTTIRVISVNTNLQRSMISWVATDGQQKKGVGETVFSFTAPALGSQLAILLTITKESGDTLTKTVTVASGDVDLLIEADTYTPPLYKGRALFTGQSIGTIVAIPNLVSGGVKKSPQELIYTWEKNNQVIQDISGYGKDTMKFQGSILSQPFSVTVTVEDPTSDARARNTIVVRPQQPQVLIYENNPLYGTVLEKALLNMFAFDREEVGLTAIPYFFSVASRNDKNIAYTWLENNIELKDPTLGSDIRFGNEGRKRNGVSEVVVGATHLSNLLQNARIGFVLNVIGLATLDTITPNENVTVF